MTIASDRSPFVDERDSDLVPGTTEVEWAEHAYHRGSAAPPLSRTNVTKAGRHRSLRFAAAAIALLLVMATFVVLLTTSTTSQAPVHQSPAARTVRAPQPALAPPLLRPSPFSYPEILTTPSR
jgi:hypothetical protein